VGQTRAAGTDVGIGVLVEMIAGVNEGGTVGVAEEARVSAGSSVSMGALVAVGSVGALVTAGSVSIVTVKIGALVAEGSSSVGPAVAVKMANCVRVALGVNVGGGSLVGSTASVGGAARVGRGVGEEKTNAVAVGGGGAGTSVRAVAQAMGVPSVGRGTVVGSSPSVLKLHPARIAATATAIAAITRGYLKRFICALPISAPGLCVLSCLLPCARIVAQLLWAHISRGGEVRRGAAQAPPPGPLPGRAGEGESARLAIKVPLSSSAGEGD